MSQTGIWSVKNVTERKKKELCISVDLKSQDFDANSLDF